MLPLDDETKLEKFHQPKIHTVSFLRPVGDMNVLAELALELYGFRQKLLCCEQVPVRIDPIIEVNPPKRAPATKRLQIAHTQRGGRQNWIPQMGLDAKCRVLLIRLTYKVTVPSIERELAGNIQGKWPDEGLSERNVNHPLPSVLSNVDGAALRVVALTAQ